MLVTAFSPTASQRRKRPWQASTVSSIWTMQRELPLAFLLCAALWHTTDALQRHMQIENHLLGSLIGLSRKLDAQELVHTRVLERLPAHARSCGHHMAGELALQEARWRFCHCDEPHADVRTMRVPNSGDLRLTMREQECPSYLCK